MSRTGVKPESCSNRGQARKAESGFDLGLKEEEEGWQWQAKFAWYRRVRGNDNRDGKPQNCDVLIMIDSLFFASVVQPPGRVTWETGILKSPNCFHGFR